MKKNQGAFINGKPATIDKSAHKKPAHVVAKQVILPTRSPVKGK